MLLLKLINGLFSKDTKRKVLEANQTRIMNLQQTFLFIQNIEQISEFTNTSVTVKSDTSVLDHVSDIKYLDILVGSFCQHLLCSPNESSSQSNGPWVHATPMGMPKGRLFCFPFVQSRSISSQLWHTICEAHFFS